MSITSTARKMTDVAKCGHAGYGYADPDEVMRLCEEAARAHLLLEIARFIRHAYRGKPSLPIEVPPLELGLIYAGKVSGGSVDAVGVYRKLDYALRSASKEAVRTLFAPPPFLPAPTAIIRICFDLEMQFSRRILLCYTMISTFVLPARPRSSRCRRK